MVAKISAVVTLIFTGAGSTTGTDKCANGSAVNRMNTEYDFMNDDVGQEVRQATCVPGVLVVWIPPGGGGGGGSI